MEFVQQATAILFAKHTESAAERLKWFKVLLSSECCILALTVDKQKKIKL